MIIRCSSCDYRVPILAVCVPPRHRRHAAILFLGNGKKRIAVPRIRACATTKRLIIVTPSSWESISSSELSRSLVTVIALIPTFVSRSSRDNEPCHGYGIKIYTIFNYTFIILPPT